MRNGGQCGSGRAWQAVRNHDGREKWRPLVCVAASRRAAGITKTEPNYGLTLRTVQFYLGCWAAVSGLAALLSGAWLISKNERRTT
jgi:hypothetical protein